jgi:hypothetical protein
MIRIIPQGTGATLICAKLRSWSVIASGYDRPSRPRASSRNGPLFPLVASTTCNPPCASRCARQLKTDFTVAQVYLKETSRIEAFLCLSLLVLLVEALLEQGAWRNGAGESKACRCTLSIAVADIRRRGG